MVALTGQILRKREVMVGKIQPDRMGWDSYVKLSGSRVDYWIWNVLARMPEGKKVRIIVEVLEDEYNNVSS